MGFEARAVGLWARAHAAPLDHPWIEGTTVVQEPEVVQDFLHQ